MVELTQPIPTSVITKGTKIKEIPLKITFFKSSQTSKNFLRFRTTKHEKNVTYGGKFRGMASIVEHVTFLKNERPPVDASGARAAQSYAQTGDERVETWHVNQEIRRISRKSRDSIYHWATPSGVLSRRNLLSVITRLTVEHRFSK